MSLIIDNLYITTAEKLIIHGISFSIHPGETHVIMGPNGSGKSTLANALMGHPAYTITDGTITLDGTECTTLSPDKRARLGLFLSQQYPPEINGVSMSQFLRLAKNTLSKTTQNPLEFTKKIQAVLTDVGLSTDFAGRSVNASFSGGEKKRAEIAQLLLLDPTYAILDEIDSGLDVDGLKAVAAGINRFKTPAKGLLIITHYQKLLDYVTPDYVHIMKDGNIIQSGDKNLAKMIEKDGFNLKLN